MTQTQTPRFEGPRCPEFTFSGKRCIWPAGHDEACDYIERQHPPYGWCQRHSDYHHCDLVNSPGGLSLSCMTCEAPATTTRMRGLYPCCATCAAQKDARTASRLAKRTVKS